MPSVGIVLGQHANVLDEFEAGGGVVQQKKVDLLLAEAQLMRETGGTSKVKWTDIDGNLYNDATWLKPEGWKKD